MNPPPERLTPLPLTGAALADRQSRIRGAHSVASARAARLAPQASKTELKNG